MTKNQLAYQANKETQRANLAKENLSGADLAIKRQANQETRRSNLAREKEQARSNKANEKIKRTQGAIGTALSALPLLVGGNDPEWYNHHPDLTRDTGAVAFAGRLGQGYKPAGSSFEIPFPGIHTVALVPTLGVAYDANSPVNKAARYLYSDIQAHTSYNKDYDQSDVMLYLGALLNDVAIYCHLVRAYNYAFLRSPKNDYLGPALAKAMGFEWTDLRDNLPLLRSALDMHKADLEKFFIPSNMDVFKRYVQMYSFVYKDGSLKYDMDQLFFAVPDGYFKFGLNGETSAGQLEWNSLPVYQGEPLSTSEWLEILRDMDAAIISNGYQDFMNISGDLEKTYGAENRIAYAPLSEVPAPVLIENDEIGHQFYNIRIPYDVDSFSIPNITQNPATGDLVWMPVAERPAQWTQLASEIPYILRADRNDFTPLDNIVATRWMPVWTKITDTSMQLSACGTELPRCIYVHEISANGAITTTRMFTAALVDVSESLIGPGNIVSTKCVKELSFKWRPLIYSYVSTASGNTTTMYPGDFKTWAYLKPENVTSMHETALRSLLYNKG